MLFVASVPGGFGLAKQSCKEQRSIVSDCVTPNT